MGFSKTYFPSTTLTVAERMVHTPNFLIYALVYTAQSTMSMKTNDIPLESPIKLQQEMQKKFGIFQNLLDF